MRYFRLIAVALSLATLSATSAFASHCPVDVQKIDEALSGDHSLEGEQLTEVKTLRNEGEALHNAGDHDGSIEKLHKALEILGMPHE